MVEEQPAVVLDGVMKKADQFTLGPIDLQIPSGYITAIIGSNGSGKSTLFKILTNLMKADAGFVEVLQMRYPMDEIKLREKIGYMSETLDVIDDSITPREWTKLFSPFYAGWDQRRYKWLMDRFKVEEYKKIKKMSKGMVQAFAFVQALSHSPELLLLDEPSSGLDPIAWSDMIEEIHRFMDEDSAHTVVLATHITEEVRRLADYVVFMYDGQVLGMYEKDQLFEDWKEIWVEGVDTQTSSVQIRDIPGIFRVDRNIPNRWITDDYPRAAAELERLGMRIYQAQPLHLDEIMRCIVDRYREGYGDINHARRIIPS